MKNIELISRKEETGNDNTWFYAKKEDGTTYSVVNCGELMKSVPNAAQLKIAGLFMGWEAMLVEEDKLKPEVAFRAETWEELKEML